MKVQRRSGLQIATFCTLHCISASEQKDEIGFHKDVIGSHIKKDASTDKSVRHLAASIAENGLHRLLNQLCKTVPGIEVACSFGINHLELRQICKN